MTDKQRAEFLKFRNEMCESKALTRALRTALQVKNTYYIEELKKPFVVAYLVPNLDNPDVKAEAVKAMFGAADNLYGWATGLNRHTIYVAEDEDTDHEAPDGPIETDYAAPPPEQEPPVGTGCEECGVEIPENVADYSRRHYGRYLCRECQRKEPRR